LLPATTAVMVVIWLLTVMAGELEPAFSVSDPPTPGSIS